MQAGEMLGPFVAWYLRLFCAYQLDPFAKEMHWDAISAMICTHSYVLPSGDDGMLDAEIRKHAEEVPEPEMFVRPSIPGDAAYILPEGTAAALWLRSNAPESADHILERVRAKREILN